MTEGVAEGRGAFSDGTCNVPPGEAAATVGVGGNSPVEGGAGLGAVWGGDYDTKWATNPLLGTHDNPTSQRGVFSSYICVGLGSGGCYDGTKEGIVDGERF